jgi:hypothetical protein
MTEFLAIKPIGERKMTKREISFWLIVDYRSKEVRVRKTKPKSKRKYRYGGESPGYGIGEIPIHVDLTLEVPEDEIYLKADVKLTETSVANVFMKELLDTSGEDNG